MIIIQSPEDLSTLRKEGVPSDLLIFITELLLGLQAEAEPEEEQDHLLHHPLLLCEPGDDVRALLQGHSMDLEYVEHIELPGDAAFRAGVLLDNDWMAQYVIPSTTLDIETRAWLEEMADGGPSQ